MRLNMWDNQDPRLDKVSHGEALAVAERVGLRNSVRKAHFDSLVLQPSNIARRTLVETTRTRSVFGPVHHPL